MNFLIGSLFSRLISGIMLLVIVAWVSIAYTAYKRENSYYTETETSSKRTQQSGSFGSEMIDPSDPYASTANRDSHYDPHARVVDDVVRDSVDYGGGDWGN